jgi:hypothetical protein
MKPTFCWVSNLFEKKYMAKKKIRQELLDMLWKLNYLHSYIKIYGPENDYDHDFVLNHIRDIVNQIEIDKRNKEGDTSTDGTVN